MTTKMKCGREHVYAWPQWRGNTRGACGVAVQNVRRHVTVAVAVLRAAAYGGGSIGGLRGSGHRGEGDSTAHAGLQTVGRVAICATVQTMQTYMHTEQRRQLGDSAAAAAAERGVTPGCVAWCAKQARRGT